MLAATVLALAAAVLHAAWNLAVKASHDRLVAAWSQLAGASLVAVPALALLGLPPPAGRPYLAASILIHVVYGWLLIAAYDRGDLSVAYPVARGSAPLLTTLGGWVLLGDELSLLGYLGVAVVSGGLVWVGLRGGRSAGLGWAVATGVMISFYTVVDTAGVRAGDESLRYVLALIAGYAVAFTPVVLVRRGPARALAGLRAGGFRQGAAGLASIASYGLVLWAVRLAPVRYVATLRESSVVFGALAGWLVLRERFGGRRTLGAAAVAAGMALLVAGA